jgi:hypothetical protein
MSDATRHDGETVIEVGNEFALVSVRKVRTRHGARLEITSPRLGHRIQLDALALESLTWQPMDTFSRFLEEPFGPLEAGDGAHEA